MFYVGDIVAFKFKDKEIVGRIDKMLFSYSFSVLFIENYNPAIFLNEIISYEIVKDNQPKTAKIC